MRARKRKFAVSASGLVVALTVFLSGCGERAIEPPMPDARQSNDAFVEETLVKSAEESEQWAAAESGSGGSASVEKPYVSGSTEGGNSASQGAASAGSESSSGSKNGAEGDKTVKGTSGIGKSGIRGESSSEGSGSKNVDSNGSKSSDGKSGAGTGSKGTSGERIAAASPTPTPSTVKTPSASQSPAKSGSGTTGSASPAASTLPAPSISPTPSTSPSTPLPSSSPEPSGKPKDRKDGPETILFSELYGEETVRGLKLSDKVNELNGQKVEMIGYMAPPLSATVRFFVLTKVAMSICPFCSTDADWPSDIVVVFMPPGKEIKPTEHEVKVTGTLSVGSQTDEETGFVSLIRIMADKTEVLK